MIRVLIVEEVPLFRCGIRATLERTGACLVLEATELTQIAELAQLQQRMIALASGRTEEIPRAGNGPRTLLYRVYINEVSEIVSVELLRGPKLPEVEAALARTTRVIMPGRLGADAVPIAAAVEIAVEP